MSSWLDKVDNLIADHEKLGVTIAGIIVGYREAAHLREIFKIALVSEAATLEEQLRIIDQSGTGKFIYKQIPVFVASVPSKVEITYNSIDDAIKIHQMTKTIEGYLVKGSQNVLPFKKNK